MRAAPAVTVHGTGGWPWRGLRTALPAASAGVLAYWLLQRAEHEGWPAIVVAVGVALAAWWRARPRAVALVWDGQRWTADGAAGALQVMIDIGPVLLLRLLPERGAARWIAVTATEAGPAWHGLRAAVYSRPTPGTARARSPERVAD
jgi:hypothetical protein